MASEFSPELLAQIRALGPNEQRQLIVEMQGMLVSNKRRTSIPRILDLSGLGKEIWEGVDVDEYLNRERDSWDG
jgi:hypothetical protein